VAVALLFSYANSEHELRVEELLRTGHRDLDISLSHRVASEWREYERMSSSTLEAYIAPTVRAYLAQLEGEARTRGLPGALHVMQSNGGVLEAASARERPLQTLLSGPVGGAMAGAALGELLDAPNLISVDMGGTSFDVSLQVRGRPDVAPELELEGLPVLLPAVRIHTIGAGGGSIAYEHSGGLRVGPESAGAVPGPVCYGRGGTQPTVTDANLLLGRLDPDYFLGGDMDLDVAASERAVAGLAGGLGLETLELADGILRVINAKMAQAIRTLTVEQGIEARDFSLVAFGGAGPMHAVFLAKELGIARVIVPRFPGALSAWGMLQAPLRHDFTQMFYISAEQADLGELRATFEGLEATARDLLGRESVSPEAIELERFADIRYVGQEHTVTVPLPETIDDQSFLEALGERFHRAHDERHGHANRGAPWEFVVLRLVALGLLSRAAPEEVARGGGRHEATQQREVIFDAAGPLVTPIVKRDDLRAGDTISGPVVVEEETATTVVPPAYNVGVDPYGNLIIEAAV
ncbi:MAG: hydantoinase/oxoprolinase family protein, partial [Gaiellaceae bacterium]